MGSQTPPKPPSPNPLHVKVGARGEESTDNAAQLVGLSDSQSLSPSKRGGSTLDLTGASISNPSTEEGQKGQDAPSILLPHQDADYISHIALDIGGSLIKLVYFSPDKPEGAPATSHAPNGRHGGKLHFVKFETAKMEDAIDFIKAKGLHQNRDASGAPEGMRAMATGGGAYKFDDIFQERLGVSLEKEDEMECLVAGCNFLLKAIRHEAFTFENGQTNYITSNADSDLFPYLLVNIGSGVSMLKVDGDGQYERVSGSSLGGGTFWGLCRLLTKVKGFDEMLELSAQGNNSKVDMLVGDIYGNRDYSSIGLSATTIASSFGKVIAENKDLEDYNPADLALALCRMLSYNIGQLAYLNAKRFGLQRILFGGFFIRGHPYTMETISFAIRFWSKYDEHITSLRGNTGGGAQGEMAALFMRHEGFLGAVGAFLKVHPMVVPNNNHATSARQPGKVRARFVERFSMGAPFSGGEVHGPAITDMSEKVSWVEKFVEIGTAATEAARTEHDRAQMSPPSFAMRQRSESNGSLDLEAGANSFTRMNLHVGILHYNPTTEPFPLLADPVNYEPNTLDVVNDPAEMNYWLGILYDQIPTVMEKALASEGSSKDAKRRAAAFGRAFAAHVTKMRAEPHAYGELGLADLFEMREECLREFGFADSYRLDKERENAAALEVLPDLLTELDGLAPRARLTALVQGVLAANIFDWGAKACVELYHAGTILEIYREARTKLSKRPWRVDELDALSAKWFGAPPAHDQNTGGGVRSPFRRVILFVDNAGADVVLGMLPFARELLLMGAEVVLAANSLPAINDVTAAELRRVLERAVEVDPILQAAWRAGRAAEEGNGGRIPPYPGLVRRIPSSGRLQDLTPPPHNRHAQQQQAGGGVSQHPRQPPPMVRGSPPPRGSNAEGGRAPNPTRQALTLQEDSGAAASSDSPLSLPSGVATAASGAASAAMGAASAAKAAGASAVAPMAGLLGLADPQGSSPSHLQREPRLYVVASGSGSPCLDLRRVSDTLADATVGVDLLVIEGMGRAIHTNYLTRFRCDCLKLAMIKNAHLAEKLFHGQTYDCVCLYEPAAEAEVHRWAPREPKP